MLCSPAGVGCAGTYKLGNLSASPLMPKGDGKGVGGGPKFSPTEREGVLEYVARMDALCYNQYQIAAGVYEVFGKTLSQPAVSVMLKEIRARLRERGLQAQEERAARCTAQYELIFNEAWESFVRSREDLERVTEEWAMRAVAPNPETLDELNGVGGDRADRRRHPKDKRKLMVLEQKLEVVRRTVVKEGRAGSAGFLTVMADCVAAIRELEGLDAPKKIEVGAKVAVGTPFDWDAFLASTQAKPDLIKEKLAAIEALPAVQPKDGILNGSSGQVGNNGHK